MSPVTDLSEPVTSKRKADDIQKHDAYGGYLHSFGDNDFGQLGIGRTNQERKFPYLIPKLMLKKFRQVACGAMHTLALEENGQLWSFGVNDGKALGRPTKTDEEESTPGVVTLPGQVKVIQVSGGDSHSAALTEDGAVYAWGCFRDVNGRYGLVADPGPICREKPTNITENLAVKIKKIASGEHHLAMLGEDGNLYTCGTASHGELGRIFREARRMTRSASRTGTGTASKEFLLRPALVSVHGSPKFTDIWTGGNSTYAMANNKSKDIYVCGLNNFGQLGIHPQMNMSQDSILIPTKLTNFKGKTWKQIAAGQRHVLGLTMEGQVYTLGRNCDGCLGRDDKSKHQDVPRLVPVLADKKCVHVAAGLRTSYAVTEAGELFAWGAGYNWQLATGDAQDRNTPCLCLESEANPIRGPVLNVEAGGLHVALTIKLSQMDCTRKKYLTMDLAEKRKEYDCKDNYVQLNDVHSWKDYFRQKNLTVATFAGDNTSPLVRDDLNKIVCIWQGDITTLEIDVIVNAANTLLLGGGGVDGAIHKAAGRGLYQECRSLNGCEEGHAKISGGYRLPAKYVIHTVGPQGEKPEVLTACYENSLKLMVEKNLRSIAFCCISTGIYGYPNDKAADVALLTVRKFLDKKENSKKIDRVIFTVFDEEDKDVYEKLMQKYFPLQ